MIETTNTHSGDEKRKTDRAVPRRIQFLLAGLLLGALTPPAMAVAVDLPYAFQAGDPVVAQELNDNFDALASALDALTIREDTTIQITPAETCTAIQQALDELDARQIVGSATVTIELLPGTFACDQSIVVRHPAGDRIRIVGTGNSADDVVLTFPPDTTGVFVGTGHKLGALQNLTLQGGLGDAGTGQGINAWDDGRVAILGLVVREFGNGLHAAYGGSIIGEDVLLTQNMNAGATAWLDGTIRLDSSSATDNGWWGFVTWVGSTMHLTNCTSEGNFGGFASFRGSMLEVVGSDAFANNSSSGLAAVHHATIVAYDVDSSSNASFGFEATNGGYVARGGVTNAVGNGVGATNIAPHTPNPSNGAVISD